MDAVATKGMALTFTEDEWDLIALALIAYATDGIAQGYAFPEDADAALVISGSIVNALGGE
jgi:hypothetical protein